MKPRISRPTDPAVAAIAAGRFVAERLAQSGKPRQRRGRPQSPRAPPDDDDDGADAYSIPAFCRRHGISESFYHKLKAMGLAPATMRIGRRVLISTEAAAAWRRAREAEDTETA